MIKYLIVTEVFAMLITFLVASCNQLIAPEMQMEVDKNLLGVQENYPDWDISYNVPQGFSKLSSDSRTEAYRQFLNQKADGLAANKIYADTITGAVMSLSEIGKSKWEEYEGFMAKASSSPLALEWNFVNAVEYKYNTFCVQQWLLQDYEWINFRLLFRKDPSFFQVDYFIPTLHFNPETDRLITSSIGSFNAHL